MSYNSNIFLGRIIKVNGYEGAVIVKLEKIFTENIPRMESVFLEIEGKPVPFFISYSEYNGADILKLKFEGYDSAEKIKEFIGCNIFLTSNIIQKNQSETITDLIHYKVMHNGLLLGSVSDVIQNPGQLLLVVLSAYNKEILIPFHQHLIVNIDKRKKIIVMDIPEGLTEIN